MPATNPMPPIAETPPTYTEPCAASRGSLRFAIAAAWVLLTAGLLASGVACASGPRWVTGQPYFTTVGQPVVWYISNPRYFTDPGDLSSYVDHAAADALVAAAAGVWNVPTASLALAQGGALAEHVSSEDVYIGSNGPVFPADVSSANYAAIPIAVIYDSDGSVTDLLLGQGASDPENCSQTAVTESVDAITPTGTIQHALLILNGRCTGPAKEQQLQLQYQLMRAFGRILGLGWSQTNDNVFTASPLPTVEDYNKWPIMHPIDIVCGPYTYACLPNPFTLRPDDVASISQLYFIGKGSAPAGKVATLSNASAITGALRFGNGQGMQGVNLLVRRHFPASSFADEGAVVSAVSGSLFRRNNGNAVTGPSPATIDGSMGNKDPGVEGSFNLGYIPELPNTELQDAFMTTEAINPLYIGQYGVGPYTDAPVTPSGPSFAFRDNGIIPYESNFYAETVTGSADTCDQTGLGSKTAPAAFPSTGWSAGSLCAYGVSAWSSVTVRANRSLTIEVTALDESGLVSENKLEPLIGVWELADANNVLPTVAAATTPFNSIAAGLTLLNFEPPQAGPLRIVVTDERGDGRPDYNFRARVLYADSVSPSQVAPGGGLVTITGTGFRPGVQVTVGGAAATLVSSTTTSLLVLVPPFAALGAGANLTADVGVIDLMSGGSSYMYGALNYAASSVLPQDPALTVLTPVFYIAAGQQVGLRPVVSLSNAGVAVPNAAVTWSAVSAGLAFPNGSQSASDGNGLATIAVNAGPLASAAQVSGTACAAIGASPALCGSFAAVGVDPSLWTLTAIEGGAQSVAATSILQPVVFQVTDGKGDPVIGVPATIYQAVSAYQVCPAHGACPIAETYQTAQSTGVSDSNGLIVVAAQQLAGTPQTTTMAVTAGTQGFISISLEKTPANATGQYPEGQKQYPEGQKMTQ